MQIFTIKDIENLTGIKAHTLRIWEQRYQFFTPKRKESLHRIYDNDDLKQLLRISFLYHNGWKISRIATLSNEEIAGIVRDASVCDANCTVFINQLIEAALDFNEYRFISVLHSIIGKIGFEKAIVEVCYPFLVKVGHLWSTNNVIPAQEHFSSYIIQNRIILETEKLAPSGNSQPGIILLTPKGEYHELPLVFINYLLRKNGWRTIFLGSNIQFRDLEHVAHLPGVQYLYVHLITNFTGFELDDYFENVCRTFSDKRIIASGEGVQRMQRNFTNLTILRSDEQIYRFIQGET